jgi:hypothetical protein
MRNKLRTTARSGATTVEAAVVLPVVFFFILAMVVGCVTVFKQQEVAHIARETARFASLHGAQYASMNAAAITAGTLPSVDDSYLTSYTQDKAFTLDPSQLQVAVTMTVIQPGSTSATNTETVEWDNTSENGNRSPYSVWTNTNTTPYTNVEVLNTVTVTISYPWSPGLLGLGTINLSSTVTVAMSY